MSHGEKYGLSRVVGSVAIIAPVLHLVSDIMEWHIGGFTRSQLLINYAAFLPMPWLLLGIYAIHETRRPVPMLSGALLYGMSFVYFLHTTLYALSDVIPDYATLWHWLGKVYTLHGGMMIVGGVLFGVGALESSIRPKLSVWLFLAGLGLNLLFGILPVPDILQIFGSCVRNAGLMLMGYSILKGRGLAS